ncbi:MAG: Stk1 family PASTA domain-containing Ser/Thr kinase [Clostridia bacterium]|nr:Stk1 family PASTA domain-containing Ser/Thr kinase [Clostridia bacterium]
MDRYIGKILNNRYEITDIIGVGGMAVVYKANDRLIGRPVAVKILKDEYINDAQFKRRFYNESRAIAMLSHVNIVDVYDVCLEDNIQYIVMELVDGITLKEYISHEKVLSWKTAVNLAMQILNALNHAHERGIIHRDIKPHNIMLLKDGTIKVTDFGIARVARFETQTMSDKTIGSVHYISPEQAKGGKIDAKADIYSVGVMLYEMLTGSLPFTAENPVSVALMQVQEKPKKLTLLNKNIPLGLEQITLKAMEKDVEKRYQSTSLMLEDMNKIMQNPEYTIGYDADEAELDSNPTIHMEKIKDADLKKDEEEEKRPFPAIAGVISALLVVLVLLGVYALFSSGIFGKTTTKMVTVPDLVGIEFAEAQANNPKLKLVKFREVVSEKYEEGEIVSQEIPSSSSVKENTEIKVVISMGAESKTVKMPDIVNISFNKAIASLQNLDIQFSIEEEFSNDVPKDYIIRTNPVADEDVDTGNPVTIYVSKGPEAKKVKVPDLIGKDKETAQKDITAAGLKVGDVSTDYDETKAEGVVLSQSIAKDTEVDAETEIDIVVNEKIDNIGPIKAIRVYIKVPVSAGDATPEKDLKVVIKLNDVETVTKTISSSLKDFTYEMMAYSGDTISVFVDDVLLLNDKADNWTTPFEN